MMNNKLLLILLGLLFSRFLGIAQEPVTYDKLPFTESQSYLKKAHFVEDSTYANWDLVYQRMEWNVNPAIWYISGKITSSFIPKGTNLSSLVFDLKNNMTVDSIQYHGTSINFTHESDKIKIQFANPIAAETLDSLSIWYQGSPESIGFGTFKANVLKDDNPSMWTLSEPYGAMTWWPCKQSLQDKIDSMKVIVTCPEGNKVGSNGILVSEQSKDSLTTVIWKHNYPIATYLVAIAVTKYASFSDTVIFDDGRQMPILNYVYPTYLQEAKSQSTNILNIMKLYNSLIGDYPFVDEKYGHAQFGWGGGMEHQTMSFMADLNFGLVAHEMAHQWFGDCITLSSWHNIWLNEGFATYMEGLTAEYLLDSSVWVNWRKVRLNSITFKPSGSVFVEDTTKVSRIFDGRLSYDKGAYLLHMLRWELADPAFFSGLQSYFTDPKIKFGFASQEDFVAHMEAAGDTSLTRFFNDWYYGEGYPIYHLNRYTDYGDNGKQKVTISQTTSDPSVNFFPMHVPLRIWKDGESKDFRLYNTTNPQTFTLPENPDSIQFDPEMWLISKNTLSTDAAELPTADQWKIYPNPATDQLTIQLPGGKQIESITIMTIKGQKIIQSDYPKSNKINVRILASGIYIVQVKSNHVTYRKQFIKSD